MGERNVRSLRNGQVVVVGQDEENTVPESPQLAAREEDEAVAHEAMTPTESKSQSGPFRTPARRERKIQDEKVGSKRKSITPIVWNTALDEVKEVKEAGARPVDMDEKYNNSPEAEGEVEDESSDGENWDRYPEIPPEEEYKFDITDEVVVVEEKKSGNRYAALRVMKNKLALLARGRKRRDKTWVPIWWHRDKSPRDELT